VKSHNDEYFFSRSPLLRMLSYARENKIPVWTELRLLDFLKTRDEASFSDFRWKGQLLRFRLLSGIKNPSGLSILLPEHFNNLKIRNIKIDGKDIESVAWRIKGIEYARVTISPGKNYDILVKYE